jgi:hypothetical protein
LRILAIPFSVKFSISQSARVLQNLEKLPIAEDISDQRGVRGLRVELDA